MFISIFLKYQFWIFFSYSSTYFAMNFLENLFTVSSEFLNKFDLVFFMTQSTHDRIGLGIRVRKWRQFTQILHAVEQHVYVYRFHSCTLIHYRYTQLLHYFCMKRSNIQQSRLDKAKRFNWQSFYWSTIAAYPIPSPFLPRITPKCLVAPQCILPNVWL